METKRVVAVWGGPERDILTLLPPPMTKDYGGDPDEEDLRLVLFREYDECDELTGAIIGLQIDDFTSFDRWHALPRLSTLWQIDDREPLPLDELLRQLQRTFRVQPVKA
jgi:hypothetical protein